MKYHIIVEDRAVLEPDPYGYLYWDSFMRPRDNVFNFREGTLILDFTSSESKELICGDGR
jgi:hypothetical protein